MSDHEITLNFGNYQALVAEYGASLRQLRVREENGSYSDVIWGYSKAENKKGGQGDVLMPFPSRLKEGQYTFDGKPYQMKINDKEGPNAIHGFLREKVWSIAKQSDSLVEFETGIQADEFQGYPFSLSLRVKYELNGGGFRCSFSVKNTGTGSSPFGAGFHPYFTTGTALDEEEVKLPVSEYLEMEKLIPTGQKKSTIDTPLDFRRFRRLGDTQLNHCFMGLIRDQDGIARAQIRNPETRRTLTIWMDSAFDAIVAYTGDAIPAPWTRKACAIEPMTCGTDAFNHPAWGLRILKAGEVFSGIFGVAVTKGSAG